MKRLYIAYVAKHSDLKESEARPVNHMFKARIAGPGLEGSSLGPTTWFFTFCFLASLNLLVLDKVCFYSVWTKISTTIYNTPENRNITTSLFCINTSISSHLSNQSVLLSSFLKRQGHLIHNILFSFSQ